MQVLTRAFAIALTVGTVRTPCAAFAQSAVQTEDWSRYIPAGWALIGDVSDGGAAILTIEKNDPSLRVANAALGPPILDLNPRRLMLLEKQGAEFVVKGSADHFLPSSGSKKTPCLADPLGEGGIHLVGKRLTIRLNYWLSCGSYSVENKTFTFRNENGRYRLIGYDVGNFSRNGGDWDQSSINYLTGRKKVTRWSGTSQSSAGEQMRRSKVEWTTVEKGEFFLGEMRLLDCPNALGKRPSWCEG
jgi:hypothetical protein